MLILFNKAIRFSIIVFFVIGSQSWSADLKTNVLACAKEIDADLRLACFDLQVEVLSQSESIELSQADLKERTVVSSSAEPQELKSSVPTKKVVPAATPKLDSLTAQASNIRSSSESVSVGAESVAADEDWLTVTNVGRRPRGEHVVHLSNGEIWAEQLRSTYFPIDIGDAVRIKKRRFSGYRLHSKSGSTYNVERLN